MMQHESGLLDASKVPSNNVLNFVEIPVRLNFYAFDRTEMTKHSLKSLHRDETSRASNTKNSRLVGWS